MHKLAASLLAAAVALGATACSAPANDPGSDLPLVGISFPNKNDARSAGDGLLLQEKLTEAGFRVELRWAGDDVPVQYRDLEWMVDNGAQAIVVMPVDARAYPDVLDRAEEAGIPVVGYQRMPLLSDGLTQFAAVDAHAEGALQARTLVEGLRERGVPQPWDVELFAGDRVEMASKDMLLGALDELYPLLMDGTVRIPSMETDFDSLEVARFDPDFAVKRLERLAATETADTELEGVIAPTDAIARALAAHLEASGSRPPLVVGSGAELESVHMITEGVQYATTFADTHVLAERTAEMVAELASGRDPGLTQTALRDDDGQPDREDTPEEELDQHVPALLATPVALDKDTVRQAVLDAGLYEPAQLGG